MAAFFNREVFVGCLEKKLVHGTETQGHKTAKHEWMYRGDAALRGLRVRPHLRARLRRGAAAKSGGDGLREFDCGVRMGVNS